MDPSVSSWCSACHAMKTFGLYKNDRGILQSTMEIILNREGLNSMGNICLKTLNGVIDNINKTKQN